MDKNLFYRRYPEFEEFTKELLKEIDARFYNALRPANEVILDDLDLQKKLHVSKRQTANLREQRLIGHSKPLGKYYYTLQDVLNYTKLNRVEPDPQNFTTN